MSQGYRAGAVKFKFWFEEFRTCIEFLQCGYNWSEIKTLADQDNIFNASSSNRSNQIYAECKKRSLAMDPSFIPIFMESSVSNQKYICLISIMATDKLFFDFVYEVIQDKFILGLYELNTPDFQRFFEEKKRQSVKVDNWQAYTLKRLSLVYRLYLVDAGMASVKEGETYTLYTALFDLAVEEWLFNHGMDDYRKALTGVKKQ